MEHLYHFGLKQDPFQNEPDLRFYFDSVSHVESYRRIERGLRQNKGLCVLTGEGGTGKTLLTRRLLECLEEEIFDAQLMLMMPGATDASSVLGRYARMVGVEDTQADRPALLAQVYEQLAIVREEGRHAVLMLDDAHLLDRHALSEIGGLLNLEYEDRRLISLLMVGLPQLDATLGEDPSLGQRVDVRARLEPLDYESSCKYLLHRLSCCEGSGQTIPPDAMSVLFKFGGGRPRLLNTLADNALFEAYLANREQLTAEDVERAAADLGIDAGLGSGHSGVLAPPEPEPVAVEPLSLVELDQVAEPEPELELEASPLEIGGVDLLEPAPPAEPLAACDDSASALDLGDLLEPGTSPEAELSTATPMEALQAEGTDDLDSAVREMMSESRSADLPVFEGHNATQPDGAEATCVGEPEEVLEASVVESDDELDDLFVELIDE